MLRSIIVRRLREWSVDTPGLVAPLTNLLMQEHVDEPVCHKCKGAGARRIRKVWQSCPTCDGTGRNQLSERQRAKAIGIARETWRRVWIERYGSLAAQLSDAERECLSGLRKQLTADSSSLGAA